MYPTVYDMRVPILKVNHNKILIMGIIIIINIDNVRARYTVQWPHNVKNNYIFTMLDVHKGSYSLL